MRGFLFILLMAFDNYIKDRFDTLKTHLEAFEKSGSKDELHSLRVELKKIRAIGRFLKPHFSKKQQRETLEPLRQYFWRAGEVRESELLGQFLLDNKLDDIYNDLKTKKTIKKREEELQKETAKLLKDIDRIERVFMEETAIDNKKLLRQYIDSVERKLEHELKSVPPKSEWHEVRKLAKRVVFGHTWLDDAVDWQKDEYYDELQHHIGEWHDDEIYYLLINVLKRNYKGNEKRIARLDEAEAKLREKRKTKEEIIEKLLENKI